MASFISAKPDTLGCLVELEGDSEIPGELSLEEDQKIIFDDPVLEGANLPAAGWTYLERDQTGITSPAELEDSEKEV